MRGVAQLLVGATVLAAGVTRTPVGTLGRAAWAAWEGEPTPDLLADFRPGLAPSLTDALQRALAAGPTQAASGPLRPSQVTAVRASLEDDALAELRGAPRAARPPARPDRAGRRASAGGRREHP